MFDSDCIDCDALAQHPEALAAFLAALSTYTWC